jgi:hypothetical protein
VALRGTRSETSMLFMGRKISKVVLDLGSGVQVQVDLTVRSRRSYRSFCWASRSLWAAAWKA